MQAEMRHLHSVLSIADGRSNPRRRIEEPTKIQSAAPGPTSARLGLAAGAGGAARRRSRPIRGGADRTRRFRETGCGCSSGKGRTGSCFGGIAIVAQQSRLVSSTRRLRRDSDPNWRWRGDDVSSGQVYGGMGLGRRIHHVGVRGRKQLRQHRRELQHRAMPS